MALTDKLTAIATAIRAKTGKTAAMTLDEMPTEISGIQAGGGGAALNIAYGDTAPEDTSKLWVKCAEPSGVVVSPMFEGVEKLKHGVSALPRAEYASTAASVGNKIYLFGGMYGSGTTHYTIYMYDAEANTIETMGSMKKARSQLVSAAIGTKIYIFGGVSDVTIEIYDTETNSIAYSSVTLPYYSPNMAIGCVGNKIYLFGASTNSSTANAIYVYDAETDTMTKLSVSLPFSTYIGSASAVCGTNIYLFGGTYNNTLYNSIYVFNTESLKLEKLSVTLPLAVRYARAVACGTNIYIFGGENLSNKSSQILKFDSITETIVELSAALPTAASYIAISAVKKQVYLFGGLTSDGGLDTINKFTVSAELPTNVVQVQTSLNKNIFPLVQSDTITVEMGVEAVYLGNSEGYVEPVEVFTNHYRKGTNYTKYYTASCANTTGTELTSSVPCSIGDLVVAAIATRDTLTLSDGWTLVSTSGINSTDTTGNGQRLSWAYKFAESATESITVTQASEQRLYINMIALQGATGVADNGYSYRDDDTSGSMTVNKPLGCVLWGMTSPLWGTVSPYTEWKASNGIIIEQLDNSYQQRLGVGLDHTGAETVTLTSGTSASTMIVGSLTIEGIDSFYMEEPYAGYVWEPIT